MNGQTAKRIIPSIIFAEDTLKELGMGLYTLRHNKGIGLDEFADIMNEAESEIEKIELGIYTSEESIDFDLVLKIVQYFDAKIEMTVFS